MQLQKGVVRLNAPLAHILAEIFHQVGNGCRLDNGTFVECSTLMNIGSIFFTDGFTA
jgi:hypothetical protein